MIEHFYQRLQSLKSDSTIKTLVILADLEEALKYANQPHSLPAVFVYPLSHRTNSPFDGPNIISQHITHTVGVLLAIKQSLDVSTSLGRDFENLITALKRVLFGWNPPNSFSSVEYSGGTFIASEKRTLFFETRWSVSERWLR